MEGEKRLFLVGFLVVQDGIARRQFRVTVGDLHGELSMECEQESHANNGVTFRRGNHAQAHLFFSVHANCRQTQADGNRAVICEDRGTGYNRRIG